MIVWGVRLDIRACTSYQVQRHKRLQAHNIGKRDKNKFETSFLLLNLSRGAGVGLVGLSCRRLGATVRLTDAEQRLVDALQDTKMKHSSSILIWIGAFKLRTTLNFKRAKGSNRYTQAL